MGQAPNESGPKIEQDRPSVYTGRIWNPAWDGSKTGPTFLQVQFWICFDPFLDQFQNGPV